MIHSLRVHGPFRGPTGYDHHVRELVRAMHAQGVAIELRDVPDWIPARLPASARDPWFETLDRPTDATIVLHCCMPHQVVPGRRRTNVNLTMFEADRIPPAWVSAARDQRLIVVPTESSARAWIASGVPAHKLRICPLGIDPELYGRPVTPIPLPLREPDGGPVARRRVRFLNVSACSPRKNLPGLLRAWLLATSSADDAILILKLGRYDPGGVEAWDTQVAALQAEIGRRLEDAAPVLVVERLFSDRDMPRLYATATHYISASFGEGWDQPMVEAGASGLKLVAPDHSAYRAYLDSSTARLLPSRAVPASVPAGSEVGDLFQGANWWEPNQGEMIVAIRAAIEGRDGEQSSPRARILRELTWERSARRLLTILAEAEAMGGRRGLWPPTRWYRPG